MNGLGIGDAVLYWTGAAQAGQSQEGAVAALFTPCRGGALHAAVTYEHAGRRSVETVPVDHLTRLPCSNQLEA